MIVILRNDWYAPNGKHYRKETAGVEIPDRFRAKLPSTAREIKEFRPQVNPAPMGGLKEFDGLRAAYGQLDQIEGDADAEQERLAEARRKQKALREEIARQSK